MMAADCCLPQLVRNPKVMKTVCMETDKKIINIYNHEEKHY